YENLASRTGLEQVKSVVTALIQAERYGTPLGQALRVLAQESRDTRMSEAEKKAAALPPKLTVPMIVFFLPVLFLVIMGPAMITIFKWRLGRGHRRIPAAGGGAAGPLPGRQAGRGTGDGQNFHVATSQARHGSCYTLRLCCRPIRLWPKRLADRRSEPERRCRQSPRMACSGWRNGQNDGFWKRSVRTLVLAGASGGSGGLAGTALQQYGCPSLGGVGLQRRLNGGRPGRTPV
ncbi:MAG: type II secretion system F family protein, partial [Nibricoccus sp.]